MNADKALLRILLQGTTHYMIPLFQRTYSWDEDDWETLWNDVIETYHAGPMEITSWVPLSVNLYQVRPRVYLDSF